MDKRIILGVLFVVLEITLCSVAFFGLTDILKRTDFPFTDSMFMRIIVTAIVYTIISLLLLILLVAMNQRITKELFNYKLAVPSLILGALIAFFVIIFIQSQALIGADKLDFYSIVIIYTIPATFLNLGLRMKLFK